MSAGPNHAAIDLFAAALIRRKAGRLVRRACFAEQDREDLEQELLLRLWQQLLAYDPSRGHLHAFITTVVNNAAADLLRRSRAARRAGRPCSLQALVHTDEGLVPLATVITQRHYDARRGFHPLTPEEATLLATDVTAVIASLPSDLRELAECLRIGTVTQASRTLGKPRSTLQDPRRCLRERFAQAGLAVFSEDSPSS